MYSITFLKIPGIFTGDFIQGSKETISYQDLYDRSVMLAGHLNSSYGSGRNILLIAPNSVFFIIAYLGILKSGNVVVPLSTEIETANLDFILEKCQSPAYNYNAPGIAKVAA